MVEKTSRFALKNNFQPRMDRIIVLFLVLRTRISRIKRIKCPIDMLRYATSFPMRVYRKPRSLSPINSWNSIKILKMTSCNKLFIREIRVILEGSSVAKRRARVREKTRGRKCFLVERSETVFLLTKYVWLCQESKMRGGYFYLGARSQGKIDDSYLARTVSPTHTEVRVFKVFV